MKKIIILLVILLSVSNIYSQEVKEKKKKRYNNQLMTIGGRDNHRSNGGFISLDTRYGKINDLNTIQAGARGGWIIGHYLAIGLEGNAFITDSKYDLRLEGDYSFSGGYGGFFIEPILFPKFLVHVTFPIHFGIGQIGYGNNNFEENWDEDWYKKLEDRDNFIFIEPGVELEFNLVKFCRLSLGVYYKHTSGIDLNYEAGMQISDPNLLNGLSGGFSLKFGKF